MQGWDPGSGQGHVMMTRPDPHPGGGEYYLIGVCSSLFVPPPIVRQVMTI